MRSDWLVQQTPWQVAEQFVTNEEAGAIAAMCIEQVIDSGENLEAALEEWRMRLNKLLGPLVRESIIATDLATSSLMTFANGTLARIFVDRHSAAATPRLAFEVIGTVRSLIHRDSSAIAHIALSGGECRTLCDSPIIAEVPRTDKNFRPVRLGIVSLDHPHATGNHFPALRRLCDAVQVVGIADSDRARCEPWMKLFGARYFADQAELLRSAEVDAVLITSENCRHASDTIAAVEAGKDVLCDKPIATTLSDTLALVRAVEQRGVRFVTTYPCRFHPAVQELRKWITEERLGEIKAIMATNHGCMYEPGAPLWVKDPHRNGGGCIIDHTVHVADLIRWLTGSEFADVTTMARTALHSIAAEDIAVSHGALASGAIYQIDSSWSRKATDPTWGDVVLRVVGTQGSASLNLYNNQRVEIHAASGTEFRFPNSLLHQHGRIFLDYQQERSTGQLGTNADEIDGLRTMELVFASYESLATGKAVSLKTQVRGYP